MSDICVKESDHLLTTQITYIAGYKCTSYVLYWVICLVAIGIQVARNYIWTKSSQATREALHEKKEKRMKIIIQLLIHTFLSMLLYIISILLILGANIGILFSVLIGNMLGVYLSVRQQKQDKSRLALECLTMIHEYNELVGNADTAEEKDHLKRLEGLRKELGTFIKADTVEMETIETVPLLNRRTPNKFIL